MKKLIILFSISASMLFLAECKSSSKAAKTASPTDAELAIAQKRWPSATMNALNEGYTTFTTKCTKCHGEKNITSRSESEWSKAIDKMAPKAKLTDSEKENLRMFVYSVRELKSGK